MNSTFVTYLQIFGIGFSFGLAGPCLMTCTPILITYISGSKRGWAETYIDIFTFLSGRLLAYVLLGAVAGFSGELLKKFTGSALSYYFQPLAGAISILFAIMILVNKAPGTCHCDSRTGPLNFAGIFSFGFLIGISPCAPLLALLFNITLMSKGFLDGAFYTFFFGLGTFLSGLITIGVIAGILTRVPAALIRSKTAAIIFRTLCALLLSAFGLGLIMGKVK